MSTLKIKLTIFVGVGIIAGLGVLGIRTLAAQGMAPAKKKVARKAAPMAAAGKAAPMAAAGKAAAKKPLIPEKDRKQVLAKIGEVELSVGSLADRINKMSRYVRGRYESVEKKRQLLDSMVEFEVLAKEAARRGFAKHPDVVRMLRQVMIQRLRQRIVEEKVKRTDIADNDVKAYYEKHRPQYNKPEMVRVSHILVKDQAAAKKVLQEVKTKGNNPREFRALVQKHSIDQATRRRAGDLRYFTREDKRVPKPVIEAAFKLQKRGEVAGPVKSDRGYHVIKLTHRKKAINRKMDDPKVRQQIVTRILRQRRRKALEAFKKELRSKAKVKIYEERLAAVKVDTTVRRGRRGFRRPGLKGLRGGMGRRRRPLKMRPGSRRRVRPRQARPPGNR